MDRTKSEREKKAYRAAKRKNWALSDQVDALGNYILLDENGTALPEPRPDAPHPPRLTLDQVESILRIQ